MTKRVRVCWTHRQPENQDQARVYRAAYTTTEGKARQWCARMDKDFPYRRHWYEPVQEGQNETKA